ncbi:ATP-grasp domain-containing protein [Haloferula sp. BvORR071]|uniref:ATP-grasp domain-containing protein n=1 Tax=Haloferula sp. BvORR071 TaxID=1396141 RepID=UPI002240F15C|nr:ATP-grasp domain-containing protein [Haloferula sp. BvORR071]
MALDMDMDRFLLRDRLWILTAPVGVPVYDFDFRRYFDCRTPYEVPSGIPGVARIGAFGDYGTFHQQCAEEGIALVHSPADHERCTFLPLWYPLIETLTPRSRWFPGIPSLPEVEDHFEFPIFIKGARQTSKHRAVASIVRSRAEFEEAAQIFRADPILHWQDFVCRELLDLRPVSGGTEGKIPASFEFRTFWWKGHLVGAGAYWYEADSYSWNNAERADALAVARRAVEALGCAFLVVDVAQTTDGRWIVIECNDGMESGYAAASPFAIWQTIADIEDGVELEP